MGRRIRLFEPHAVYSTVIRCVDRQFMLRPDHDTAHPLLAAGCPPEALDPTSPVVPVPSVVNVIGSAAARALELSPVRLHALESNINHLGSVFSTDADQWPNIPHFLRNLHSSIARQLNRKWDREGRFWAGPHRPAPCEDDRSAEQQLVYHVTNPVKDNLVETVSGSPLFTSFRALGRGEAQRYFLIDWDAFHRAGGWRRRGHSPKEHMRWLELTFAPLPQHADWPEHRRRTWVRQQVRAVEEHERDRRRREGRAAMGAAAQRAVDPRSRPAAPKKSGPQPYCHCSNWQTRVAYIRRYREVQRAHCEASIQFRLGHYHVEFPEGTFRPPLIRICRADE